MELFFKDEVFNIVGAPIEVLGELGPGFLSGTEESQMINYLKATGMRVGNSDQLRR